MGETALGVGRDSPGGSFGRAPSLLVLVLQQDINTLFSQGTDKTQYCSGFTRLTGITHVVCLWSITMPLVCSTIYTRQRAVENYFAACENKGCHSHARTPVSGPMILGDEKSFDLFRHFGERIGNN